MPRDPQDTAAAQADDAWAEHNARSGLAQPVGLLDATAIPPRRFVYGRHLQRRYMSVSVATGGTGKSTVALIEAVAMVTGRALLHDRPYEHDLRVWYINAEDPRDEIDRRIAAILTTFNIPPAEIADRLFVTSGREARIKLAQRDARNSAPIQTPDVGTLHSEMQGKRIDVLILDPYARFHLLKENDNDEMNFVATILSDLADRTNAAIDVVHHTRKPASGQSGGGEGDANIARGASALVDASRAARTITTMCQDDAKKFGLPTERARWHVRLDNAKASMFPPATEANWLERESVHLPNGDNVGVLKVWIPPDTWAGLSPDRVNTILDAIEAGPGDGERFTISKQSPERWAGRLLVEQAGRTDAQATQIIKAWTKAGVPFLKEDKYASPSQRRDRKGLFVIGRPGAAS